MKFDNKSTGLLMATLAGALLSTSPIAQDRVDDEDELSFDVARLFFELNNTDGDLGIHAEVDGDPWRYMEIEDSNDRSLLKINVKSRLRKQGLTEIFFESAEPTFDELSPKDFFARFPQGTYEIEAITLEGEEMEAEVFLSHVMPAPPANVTINGLAAAEDCDEDELPEVTAPVMLSWDPVTSSHPDLGESGAVEVEYYEVVIEIDDTAFHSSSIVPPSVTSVMLSDDIIALSDEIKFEILVRDVNGNKTAVESCFIVE